MDRQTYKQIIAILTPFFTNAGNRQEILNQALWGQNNLVAQIDYSGTPAVFTANLISQLDRYGSFDDKPAVVHLLDEVQTKVGDDKQKEIGKIKASLGHPDKTDATAGATSNRGSAPTGGPSAGGSGGAVRDQVFISYSHKDAAWMERLKTNLIPLMRTGTIRVWDDQNIKPGDKWRDEINNALAASRVAVLMVSANFLASEFISKKELPELMNAAENSALRVIWFPVSHSLVKETTEITEYQGAGGLSPNKPLDSLSLPEQNATLVQIARDIMAAYNSFDE